MRGIEWLKEEVEKDIHHVFAEGDIYYVSREHILGLIDQLDTPEVLSDEWIKDNQLMWTSIHGAEYYVPANKLYGKLVPEQEEVDQAYKDGYEKGKQHTFYKGYLEGLTDKENEPETVADVISDFYKSLERFKEVLGTKVEELEE